MFLVLAKTRISNLNYLAMIKMRFEKDAAAKQTLAETFLTKTLPNWLAGAEKMLKARGGKWYAGNQVGKDSNYTLYSQPFPGKW